MKRATIAAALGVFGATGISAAATPNPPIAAAALAAAAQRATLRDIDYGSAYCDGGATVAQWLKALVGNNARAITWTGGKCILVNKLNPLDAAVWPYCAQAAISLTRPKARGDRPTIEIYFERPQDGRPGPAYAFRSLMMTRDDGPDYERFRKDFEAQWRERFSSAPQSCED